MRRSEKEKKGKRKTVSNERERKVRKMGREEKKKERWGRHVYKYSPKRVNSNNLRRNSGE